MASEAAPLIIVRPLVAEDVDAVIEMFATVADEGRWMGTEGGFDRVQRAEGYAKWLELPDAVRALVVEDAMTGAIVGTGNAAITPYGVVEVGMALADGWRGKGIGGELIDALITEARALGGHKVALQVWPHNARGLALYHSHGFVDEGRLVRHYRRANGELWDAVVMGLVLDDTTPGSPYGDQPLVS